MFKEKHYRDHDPIPALLDHGSRPNLDHVFSQEIRLEGRAFYFMMSRSLFKHRHSKLVLLLLLYSYCDIVVLFFHLFIEF
jgi:hypothetical protein